MIIVRLATLQTRLTHPLEASFARSLLGFNPFLHQPPPPSYPLFVAAGKFLNFFLHSAVASLLVLSVIGSAATFVLLARALPGPIGFVAALIAALIPFATQPLPDAPAVACLCAAVYFRDRPALRGIAAAAAVGFLPQTIFAVIIYLMVVERRLAAWWAFVAMLFVEFLQVMQNIELRRMRAFVAANIDLRCTLNSWGARVTAAVVLLALTYHLFSAKTVDLAGDPDVQRRGEH